MGTNEFDILSYLKVSIPDSPQSSPLQSNNIQSSSPLSVSTPTSATRDSERKILKPSSSAPVSTSSPSSFAYEPSPRTSSPRSPATTEYTRNYSSPHKSSSSFSDSQRRIAAVRRPLLTTQVNPLLSPSKLFPYSSDYSLIRDEMVAQTLDYTPEVFSQKVIQDASLFEAEQQQLEQSEKPVARNLSAELEISDNQEEHRPHLNNVLSPATQEDNVTVEINSVREQSPRNSPYSSPSPRKPRVLGVSEYVVQSNTPGEGKIVYEVLDIDLPSNTAENLEMVANQQERQRREREEETKFYQNEFEKNLYYLQYLREEYLNRRLEREHEYKTWVEKKSEHEANEKQEIELQRAEAKVMFAQIDKKIEEQHRNNLVERQQNKQWYREQLVELQDYRKTLHRQIEEEERHLTQTSIPGIPKRVLSAEEWTRAKRENADAYDRQINEKKEQIQFERAAERSQFNQKVQQDMNSLRREFEQNTQQREALRETLKSQWQDTQQESQQKKQNEQYKRHKELSSRLEIESRLEQGRKDAIIQRAKQLTERKKQLDKQVEYITSLRSEDEAHEKAIEQQLVDKWRNNEVRKKLYRCAKTRKILPPNQFNEFIMDIHQHDSV